MENSILVSSEQMLELVERGNYEHVDPKVIRAISLSKSMEMSLQMPHIHHFGSDAPLSTEEAVRNLRNSSLSPATLADLLKLGASYPNERKSFIAALGTEFLMEEYDIRLVATIQCHGGNRKSFVQ